MNFLDKSLDELAQQGWSIADNLLPSSLSLALLQQAQQRWQNQCFHAAAIGREKKQHLNKKIRGDSICWLQPNDCDPTSQQFLAWAQDIQEALNQAFFLGLRRFECHFARYAPGAGYAKHIDQHQHTGFRKISMVLYLNPAWQADLGGELVIYDPESSDEIIANVIPEMGRLVLFRSDSVPHAVLPCHAVRWSLAGWFRNDSDIL
ncbi:2OG-Fe(II) oxygenase [Alcaligenes endophyticus]|uniref:2OG-Fe(II) oxygenase n=1 Tax=Alcaligenes endophyticus TaxID=1929088 RepID=A0ABT8EKM5_9BURK|nr:2OG-Fe(II) oxygenase [Alcaligenes endophyticus]MCX5590800.1 2OG-Fe(II) oxygenase [Alcaligenes endophyticus]MDN4121837.1 2OG-Fe(II) oxygenase [Alcaligenes endophyticus]